MPEGFLAGVNVPWNEFGQDAGCGKFDQAWFDRTFADIAEQGVTSVRYWLHASGGCTPSFAADGTPTGLPPTAIPEATAILDAAERNGLSVLLVDAAWPRFERGDRDGYLADVAAAVRPRAADTDVVVLAQASMAGAQPLLADLGVPVLSSPALGVARAVLVASSYGAFTALALRRWATIATLAVAFCTCLVVSRIDRSSAGTNLKVLVS